MTYNIRDEYRKTYPTLRPPAQTTARVSDALSPISNSSIRCCSPCGSAALAVSPLQYRYNNFLV